LFPQGRDDVGSRDRAGWLGLDTSLEFVVLAMGDGQHGSLFAWD
jgi:hypothetical protein